MTVQLNASDDYAPDFPLEAWSERDRWYLEPFATNIDGWVTVLRNLPPELVGALCSRASRAKGHLLRVLLEEYIYPIADGEDRALADELNRVVSFLHEHGFAKILNNQRAQRFFAKWLSQFGDDSIAQMTGTHLLFRGISQVAMKFVEDQRIGLEPIEKSTRYVDFSGKVGGKYLYYVPRPDLERPGLLDEYCRVMDLLFDTYASLLELFQQWLREQYDEKPLVLEKKAFDTLRGLLPMATLGQVAFRGNAQALEYLINRTAQHELGELRWIAKAARNELNKEIPSLLLRCDDEKSILYQRYLSGRSKRVREAANRIRRTHHTRLRYAEMAIHQPQVRLIRYDPNLELELVTAILFQSNHLDWEEQYRQVQEYTDEEREDVIMSYMKGRSTRWQKAGRAFENSFLRFEIVMNAGAYRDLHRHRMLTQERQRFSTFHGFDVPEDIISAGFAGPFNNALAQADALFRKIQPRNPELAQYIVPLASRMRFYQWTNVRQLFWEMELRTIPQGHPDYRFIEQEKFRLFTERFPLFRELMLVDTAAYPTARRGQEERSAGREKRIVESLRKG